MTKNHKTGFTLIELLVVISIVGLLSSVVLSATNSARTKAEDSKQIQALNQLKRAMELYYDANDGLYPDLGVAGYSSYRLNGWDSTGNTFAPTDPAKLAALNPYLSQRPRGTALSGFAWGGYYYKVSSDRKQYKIVLSSTIKNASSIPSSMSSQSYGGTNEASIWSSNAAKGWYWFTAL